eukprot:scaffold75850_cov73-Cyclotella_meneghiniana.AAC.1
MDAMLLSFTSLGVSLYNVIHAAMMDITEQAIITLSSPSCVATGKNIMEPRRAPTFPLAAQTPFNVERHEREKARNWRKRTSNHTSTPAPGDSTTTKRT